MLADLLDRVDKLKAELDDVRPLSTEDAHRLRAKLNLEWNYHSNAIEGNTLTLGETRAFIYHGITASGKPFKDYLDIKGHKAAIEHIEAIVREDHPLTEADIRQLHELLLVEPYEMDALTPDGQPTKRMIQVGEYKSMPNSVRTSTGELHSYASPEETPALMGDLMKWYRKEMDNAESHPVMIAALFHHRFVSIHPFDDGNGRMTRILMNLSLMQAGYVPVVIRNEQRDAYILALSQADAGETEPFIEFIAKLEIKSLELALRAARGESIDEPDDLDKKLSLLQKQIKGADKNKFDYTLAFLEAFLEKLAIQLPKFKSFFERNRASLFDHKDIPVLNDKNISRLLWHKGNATTDVSLFAKRADELLRTENAKIIFLYYSYSGFVKNPDKKLRLIIMFDMRKNHTFCCTWLINTSEPLPINSEINTDVLIDSSYKNLTFSEEEIDAKVKIITDEIYRHIEQFAEQST